MYQTFVINCDPNLGESALGRVIGHLSLPGTVRDIDGTPRISFGKLMRRFVGRMIKDVVSGDRKRKAPFDPKTRKPISTPTRLTEAERLALT